MRLTLHFTSVPVLHGDITIFRQLKDGISSRKKKNNNKNANTPKVQSGTFDLVRKRFDLVCLRSGSQKVQPGRTPSPQKIHMIKDILSCGVPSVKIKIVHELFFWWRTPMKRTNF